MITRYFITLTLVVYEENSPFQKLQLFMAQVIGLMLLSVFLIVLGREDIQDIGNSTVPDSQVFECSFPVKVYKSSSQVDLCSLKGDVTVTVVNKSTRVVPQSTAFGGTSRNINIHRYYRINLFNIITTHSIPTDPSRINCPYYSMSCLNSDVTFECNEDQDVNGVCTSESHFTADSYGYRSRWHKQIYPPQAFSSKKNVKGATAVITMQGGPCYYCENLGLKLNTLVEFYCDERKTEKGTIRILNNPTQFSPRVTLQWNTSAACYEFDPQAPVCHFYSFSNICQHKPFSCSKHNYSIPASQNHSLMYSTSTSTYKFGFCAKDIQCPSTDKNVMICKLSHEDQTYQPLAYYSDNIEFIARPTGFVMRIRQIELGSYLIKVIISFECSPLSDQLSLDVLENDAEPALPIVLSLKHRCFCPDTPSCQEAEKSLLNAYHPPTSSVFEIIGISCGILVFFVIVYFIIELVKKKWGRRGSGGGGSGEGNGDHQGNTGGTPNDSTSTPSSYHSCLSNISTPSNGDRILTESTPLLSGSASRTPEPCRNTTPIPTQQSTL